MAGDMRCENRRLRSEIARLRAKLAALGEPPGEIAPAWTSRLTPTQAAIVGVLLDRHPRWVNIYDLEEMTRLGDHARERDVRVIDVMVLHIRQRLGRDAIVRSHGRGLALSDATAAALRAEAGA